MPTFKDVAHADLKALGFEKKAGGQWYAPNENSDFHVHLIGLNHSPGYDPVKNRNPPEFLTVKKVELKVTQDHRWWGDIQDDGTFNFDSAKIAKWGPVNKSKATELLKKVPPILVHS